MLCPECEIHVSGGERCPRCAKPVPERETFGGQGKHYLLVLVLFSIGIFLIFFIISILGSGFKEALDRIFSSRWSWLFALLFFLPVGIGIYTWSTLRTEEITVTDEFISKHSRWGDQRFRWSQITSFRRIPFFPRRRWIQRNISIRRLFSRERLVWHLPALAYELEGIQEGDSEPSILYLEPGTIDDLPWLLKLIEEHIGPPQDETS